MNHRNRERAELARIVEEGTVGARAKWTDESKPIITRAESVNVREYHINAEIRVKDTDALMPQELRKVVEHMECIVRAYRENETHLI